jgi:hypothetical protein
MQTSTLSYQLISPACLTAQSLSAAPIIAENGPEEADNDTSSLSNIIENNNEKLDEARRAVTQIPIDHPEWITRSRALASLLLKSFEKTSECTLLEERVEIQRQICNACTAGNPERAASISDLASSLRTYFKQTGEESLPAEAITLSREALSLRPRGHPDWSMSCVHLATSLWIRFEQIGVQSLLTEAINLQREALSFQTNGHPERSTTCDSLAVSLWTQFNHTGEESLLAEVIELQREALSLRPHGNPDRSNSCYSLARALWTRFNQTGEQSLLTEAIELHREALSLRPSGHPHRSNSCNSLATSLSTCFNYTGEGELLTEAIELHREALSLQSSGHPNRFASCSNLALSLCARFKQTRDESQLVEAINLHREALSLLTSIHPDRLEVCNRLVTSLRMHFEVTGDESLAAEAVNLSKSSMETQPLPHPSQWKRIINQAYIYLNPRFSRHNTVLAIDYIHQALSFISHDWPMFLTEVAQIISLIDLPVLSKSSLSRLLQCFSAAIDLAFRVAGFVLDPKSQLQYLSTSQHLGPRAYWCALASGQPELGLELIERTRAIIWAQALYIRSPQLSGAFPELESELEVLLHRMRILRNPEDPTPVSSHYRDVRHKNGERIHRLIQQIRTLPGQERFMRGLSSNELAQCASRNVVVLLVATEGECHALILQAGNQEPVTLKLPCISSDGLSKMSIVAAAAKRRGSASETVGDDARGMKASPYGAISHQTRLDRVLEMLWITVVKPVIHHFGFQVGTTIVKFGIMLVKLSNHAEILRISASAPPLVPNRPLHVPSAARCRYI